jgi:hypothetical protein
VQLWGHGLRARQVRGPVAFGGDPALVTVDGRRYQCQVCEAVLIVEPRSVLRYRHFSGSAVAMALALFGVEGASAAQVRRRVSPWRTVGNDACRGWVTLHRWIDVARGGQLLPAASHRVAGDDREVAARVARAVASRAPPPWDAPVGARAFAGAALPA